jgi:hypothetical protein
MLSSLRKGVGLKGKEAKGKKVRKPGNREESKQTKDNQDIATHAHRYFFPYWICFLFEVGCFKLYPWATDYFIFITYHNSKLIVNKKYK